MPIQRTRNLFISHSWKYGDAYTRLINLLNAAPRFSFRDYSVPKDDPVHDAPTPDALREAIKRQMVFCQVVVVVAGKYATHSDWIQEELLLAKGDFDKPVLAIKPFASTQVSSVVRNAADLLVNWSTSSILGGIRKLNP